MTTIRLLVLAFLGAILLMVPQPLHSGLGPLMRLRGDMALPPNGPHETIRLEAQTVFVQLRKSEYIVNSEFKLVNDGATTTLPMGFHRWLEGFDWYPSCFQPVRSFRASINGRPISFKEELDLSRSRELSSRIFRASRSFMTVLPTPKRERQWLVSRLCFRGKARTTIRIAYRKWYIASDIERHAAYWCGSASLWKGPVEKSEFIIDPSEVGGPEMVSMYFRQGLGPGALSQSLMSKRRLLGKSTVYFQFADFDPHPETELLIRQNTKRARPIRQPPPIETRPLPVIMEPFLPPPGRIRHLRLRPVGVTPIPRCGPASHSLEKGAQGESVDLLK